MLAVREGHRPATSNDFIDLVGNFKLGCREMEVLKKIGTNSRGIRLLDSAIRNIQKVIKIRQVVKWQN
jgi:hypothetical protein